MKKVNELIEREMRGCFDYFWNETNSDENSKGYGITRDQSDEKCQDFGSIAATGFALAAYAIGVNKGYISKTEGYQRALGTLETFDKYAEGRYGFFYHFLHLKNAFRWEKSEVSDIDTMLFIMGALTAAGYFGGEVKRLADKLFDKIQWHTFVNPANNCFYMGYTDDGFIPHYWDHYAEHLGMCILGAGARNYPSPPDTLYAFRRDIAEYDGYKYIRTHCNALFVHQFSHAFIDFRGKRDREGVDWFENSVQAALGHRAYCIRNEEGRKTYSKTSWGLSACQYKYGYSGAFGAMPMAAEAIKHLTNDGTVPPYGAVASVVFTPQESLEALEHYGTIPQLWTRYGLTESYNLDETPAYFNPNVLGIDKGITITMLANYEDEFVWKHFMKNEYVQKGLEISGISP